MKALIAVELYELDGKATCAGCVAQHENDEMGTNWCFYNAEAPRKRVFLKEMFPGPFCPLRGGNAADANVRDAERLILEAIDGLPVGYADPRLRMALEELKKARE